MSVKNYLIDMDGVLVQGKRLIPGADGFIERLKTSSSKFLILTNNPLYTPGDLAHRLQTTGHEQVGGAAGEVQAQPRLDGQGHPGRHAHVAEKHIGQPGVLQQQGGGGGGSRRAGVPQGDGVAVGAAGDARPAVAGGG